VKYLIIIRKFQPSDFQLVIDIERKVFNEHDPYLYMQFYENYPETFIVAEINGFIVGYVAGFQAAQGVGRIFSIAVHPLYQRRRIGSSLLNGIIHLFKEMHLNEIILEVRWSNVRAKKFYERYGFFQYDIAEKYYNGIENARLMRLRL
jgi:ribosomal-protein-alanine N-acetyltransferase